MFNIRVLWLVFLFSSHAFGEASEKPFAEEALEEVDKLLEENGSDKEGIESYVDCLGERVYIQRADQECPSSRKALFIIEPKHSIVATYCLKEKEDPAQSQDLKAYYGANGEADPNWIMTSERPTKKILKALRCRGQAQRKTR